MILGNYDSILKDEQWIGEAILIDVRVFLVSEPGNFIQKINVRLVATLKI